MLVAYVTEEIGACGRSGLPVCRLPRMARKSRKAIYVATVRFRKIFANPADRPLAGMRLMTRILPRCIIDLVIAVVPKAIAKWAEAEMVSETYEFQDRRKIAGAAPNAAREAARTAKAEGKAEDVLTVLEERGLAVSGEERDRIVCSVDSHQLDKWLRRAVTVDKASDLFVD
jgi:hypothetical protein